MLSEAAESFTVTLGTITTSLPSTQVVVKSDEKSATATIAASDPITVSITGPSNVDEGDATTAYTVSLSPDGVTPTDDLKVDYATADGTATQVRTTRPSLGSSRSRRRTTPTRRSRCRRRRTASTSPTRRLP